MKKLGVVLLITLFSLSESVTTNSVSLTDKDELLRQITLLTEESSASICADEQYANIQAVPITTREEYFESIQKSVDLVHVILRSFIGKVSASKLKGNVHSALCEILKKYSEATTARIIIQNMVYMSHKLYKQHSQACSVLDTFEKKAITSQLWYMKNLADETDRQTPTGKWTSPYFNCNSNKWTTTYTSDDLQQGNSIESSFTLDVDISQLDINQCNSTEAANYSNIIDYFEETHKCHNETSICLFEPGQGWKRGGYSCVCREGFYSRTNGTFNGSFVEVTWENSATTNSYNYLYKCLPCAPGCQNCTDGSPCLAEYNWPFRIALLTISIFCILITLIVMLLVYHMKSLKVFKMASPAFLQICLFGCIIMYLEMAVIFPILNMFYCVLTKWFRHMGFCLTFSSLVMKTWRVSLTYRVKSAHKIKLTDKQLLQWMTPVVLIMVVYLSSWTIRDPPEGDDVEEGGTMLRFKQCTYDYWDHSLAIGEMLFLLWGSKVCWGVRKAESFFDEAKCITWAVYNITVVNVIMATFHVFIFSNAGPDVKYFFGFLRTQLSTTVTIALVFGPKFLRVLRGKGNELDANSGAASFPVNGIGTENDEAPDPAEENEELKEEIQKLAAQIEFMKILNMEMNNRHLKPKAGGYFTDKSCFLPITGLNNPPTKAAIAKFETADTPSSAICKEIIDDQI